MKRLLLILPVFLTCAVRADLVVTQKIESSMVSGEITTKIKGEKGRVDMPGGPNGAMSVIINGPSGELLIHSQKRTMKTEALELKGLLEKVKAAASSGAPPEKPKATGRMEKIGEWDAEIFEVKMGGWAAKVWVAKSFPNADKVKAELSKISKTMGQTGGDPYSLDLPGLPVKTELDSPLGRMTVTMTKISEVAVDDKEFVAPADYKAMEIPPGLGK